MPYVHWETKLRDAEKRVRGAKSTSGLLRQLERHVNEAERLRHVECKWSTLFRHRHMIELIEDELRRRRELPERRPDQPRPSLGPSVTSRAGEERMADVELKKEILCGLQQAIELQYLSEELWDDIVFLRACLNRLEHDDADVWPESSNLCAIVQSSHGNSCVFWRIRDILTGGTLRIGDILY
jgi:hypothetical protein